MAIRFYINVFSGRFVWKPGHTHDFSGNRNNEACAGCNFNLTHSDDKIFRSA